MPTTKAMQVVARATRLSCAAAFVLAVASCDPDLFLSAGNLEIGPNPAQTGDTVVFVFRLTLVPEQSFTAVALIDDVEHTQVTRIAAIDGPFAITVGDAEDLIARYGTGIHRGYVVVRLNERSNTARTAGRDFELQVSTP